MARKTSLIPKSVYSLLTSIHALKIHSFLQTNINKERKIIKNTILMVSMGIISAFFSTSSNLIFSRFLGPSGYGLFKIAISLASTAAYGLDFGMKILIPRYIAEFDDKKQPENIAHLIERTLSTKAIIALFIVFSAWLFSHKISQIFFHSPAMETLLWPTVLVFVIVFLDITIPILIGYQNFRLVALTSILVPFMHIIFGIPLVYLLGINGILLAAAMAFVIGSIPGIKYIIKKAKKGSKIKSFSFKNAIFNYSLPAYFASIPTYIYIVIIPILSLFFNQRQIGLYSFSLSFFTGAQLIPLTIGNVMFPKIAQLNSRNNREAQQTFNRLILIYTPFAILGSILIVVLAGPIVSLLVPAFLPAVKIIIIQTIAALILGYFSITVFYLTAIGKLRTVTFINWATSAAFGTLAFYVTSLTK